MFWTESEYESQLKAAIGTKSTVLAYTAGMLYTGSPKEGWIYTGLSGMFCLIIDRTRNSDYFFCLYDPDSFDLLFEIRIFADFHDFYKIENPNFHTIVAPDVLFGMSFADPKSAETIHSKISKESTKRTVIRKQNEKPQKSSTWYKLKGKIKSLWSEPEEEKPRARTTISRPMNVTHVGAIKFDVKQGVFDIATLPPEWVKLFFSVGITTKDLCDKELAPFLFDRILKFNGERQSIMEEHRRSMPRMSCETLESKADSDNRESSNADYLEKLKSNDYRLKGTANLDKSNDFMALKLEESSNEALKFYLESEIKRFRDQRC